MGYLIIVKLSYKTEPFKTLAEKYLSSDVSIILFTDKKLFTVGCGHTKKCAESSAVQYTVQQPRRTMS